MGSSDTNALSSFGSIVRENQSLAPFTWLQIGGPTRYLIEPNDPSQMIEAVQACHAASIPVRLIGGGTNLLIRESGFHGATFILSSPAFARMSFQGDRVICGGGAKLSHLIAYSVGLGLGGLEHLVGIPGTVGGALRGNAGTDEGDIGQVVESAQLLTRDGSIKEVAGKQLAFSHRTSSLDELVILDAKFRLEQGDVRHLTKREQTFWILKRSKQPSFPERAAIAFVDPDGHKATELLQQSGFNGASEGAVRLSSTYPNYLIAAAGSTSAHVLTLLERVREGVRDRTGVQLQSHLQIW
jgi:UDP-N-acetylmuramate dehydrogenase